MTKIKHKCLFEKIPAKLELSIWEPNVYAIEDFLLQISLFFKGQKKAKKIKQCRKCGRYAIECPYCHTDIEADSLPQEMTCNDCNNTFYILHKHP